MPRNRAIDLNEPGTPVRKLFEASVFEKLPGVGKMHEHLWGKDYLGALAAARKKLNSIEVCPPRITTDSSSIAGHATAHFGRIINVTSLVTRGFAFCSSYAAGKAALESLTRTMAVELAGDGITANAIVAGSTETELFRANTPRGGEGEARYLRSVRMSRFGQPDEIAAAIAFLAEENPAFITGRSCCGSRCKPGRL